ncbi:hypothetical protein ACVNPZ_12905 [Staphylococcus aureus]
MGANAVILEGVRVGKKA